MTRRTSLVAVLTVAVGYGLFAGQTTAPATGVASAPARVAPRERISINDDWRFQKDDPPGNTVSLLYDVRPEVKDAQGRRPGGRRARRLRRRSRRRRRPSSSPGSCPPATRFIKDPARRFVRPAGNWGGDVRLRAGGISTTAPGGA